MKVSKAVTVLAATGGLMIAGAGAASASVGATGATLNPQGAGSGLVTQAPFQIELNACGASASGSPSLLNPAFSAVCGSRP